MTTSTGSVNRNSRDLPAVHSFITFAIVLLQSLVRAERNFWKISFAIGRTRSHENWYLEGLLKFAAASLQLDTSNENFTRRPTRFSVCISGGTLWILLGTKSVSGKANITVNKIDNEECRLLGCGAVDLVWTDVSEERIASIFKVGKSASEEPGGCRHLIPNTNICGTGCGMYGRVHVWPSANQAFTHSRSWALLEKPPIVQLLENLPAFYGTRRFITAFT
jgi:hypothetical protein